ncbi:MAG: AmpG family muropeptide MFS transporter [Deltaproteobacteria bacterium]|nr:AmpG family muropeptide MFS transporter [Deltaproteobacteria bacterium]
MPKILAVVLSRRMLVSLLMGFSCGLPLLLTMGLLQAWMQQEGVDLATIGLITLVQIPYTLKFVWAPVLDRFTLPFLGRRRGWLLIIQFALIAAVCWLAFSNPGQSPLLASLAAVAVAFASASQDIVVDAYRREDLADEELGLGSSLYVNGYRLGMLLASGGGMIMADFLSFTVVYLIMAASLLVGVVTTLFTPEPPTVAGAPATLREAVVEPFVEFFSRSGVRWGLLVLAFILLYKIGDSMASAMTTPFYLELGFTKAQIGTVVKLFGFWATIAGALAGGVLILKMGISLSLWVFGFLQAVSTAGFAVLAQMGPSLPWLAAVIGFENLSAGLGSAAFMAFMAALTNKRFTATQYALLSSLIGVPRSLASAPTGYLAQALGWQEFFIFCTLMAIPGMLMLAKFAPFWKEKAAQKA